MACPLAAVLGSSSGLLPSVPASSLRLLAREEWLEGVILEPPLAVPPSAAVRPVALALREPSMLVGEGEVGRR